MISKQIGRRRKRILAVTLTIMFLLSVFGGFKLFKVLNQPYNQGMEEIEAKKPKKDKPTVIVITGVDERASDKGRSDTLLIGFIDKKNDKISLVSIPRDSHVEIPGRGMDKINHAYAFGGMSLTIKTVEQLLGIPVNYYVKTNLEGFTDIVDIVGGIEVNVEKEIVFKEAKTIVLKKGVQNLDSEEALAYVRFRGDAKGDFGRMERQQNFLKALFKKGVQPSNIIKAPRLIPELKDAVETNMSLSDMLAFSGLLKNMNMQTYSLEGKPFSQKGVSYVKVNEDKKENLITELFGNR